MDMVSPQTTDSENSMTQKIEDEKEALPSWGDALPDFIGISLRDWFAGMALQAVASSMGALAQRNPETAAVISYKLADAMLKARGQ